MNDRVNVALICEDCGEWVMLRLDSSHITVDAQPCEEGDGPHHVTLETQKCDGRQCRGDA